ncbi:MAG: ABC transporter permease [Chitinophagaceae bacterium]|nr:ABC transporter permease [Chitinophagaceae bacterium]
MFKNYLKTALRNLNRNKSYILINVLGLSVGIAACILIFVVVKFETSFDNFHSKKDKIYRIASEFHGQDGISYSGGISFAVAPAVRREIPKAQEVASIFKSGNDQITIVEDGKTIKKFTEDVYFAEPEFFKMFDFDWLSGNAKTLTEPNTAALTLKIAEKYFGDWKLAIGKTIKRNNDDKQVLRVTGILKDVPENTDFPLGVVASYATLQNTNIKRNMEDWVSTFGQAYSFVVLSPGYSPAKFAADVKAIANKYKPEDARKDAYVAQPLSEMHYDEEFGNFTQRTFSKSIITAITLIGLFLLIIACVNFINLATAQAVNRSKEVGVRKVLGGNRGQLVFQFLSETALITLAAVILGVVIAVTTLPFVNRFLGVQMAMNFINSPLLILFLLIVLVLVTLLSGFYPAMILSGFNPITALKNKVTAKMVGGISLRRALVVLQFAIAHVLIIGTIIVASQMDYFRNASLGFDKEAIVTVPVPNDSVSQTKVDYLRNSLLKNSDIKDVSFSFASPSAEGNWNSVFMFDHSTKNTDFSANLKWADAEYFKMYKLQFVAGKPYETSDTVHGFVVNETLLKKLGITNPADAIGKELNFWDRTIVAPIVGVVKDFNSYSLREPVAPVVLGSWKRFFQTINIKINPSKAKPTLAFVEKLWNNTYPEYVYSYQFLDEAIANFYRQENQLSLLYKIFAAIAIFISCLGLYGLVSFMAVQRTKELGIRKILGATAANIVYLLSKEFSLLIIVAFIIAGPFAYYIMNKWLQNYTYRIGISLWIFLLAIIGSMVIAWITVGHRAIKAAMANPVKNLRTE